MDDLVIEPENKLMAEPGSQLVTEQEGQLVTELEDQLVIEPETHLVTEPEAHLVTELEDPPEQKDQLETADTEERYVLPCKYCDIDIVQKLEQVLLHGVATACVEKTASDLFRGPSAVAPDVSKELVEFLMEKTEYLLSDSAAEDDANLERITKASTHPVEYISELVESFIGSKRNLLIRVSGWISSETREAKIEDTAHQIAESNSFRSIVAVLLRNMDIKGKFHCPEKFGTQSEFELHKENCAFRPFCCQNEGCGAVFSALRLVTHDFTCPFKVLPCDQVCGERVVRYDMEKHCNTVCTMRLVNCPFFNVGCETAFPYISLEKHCSDFVQQHLMCVLRSVQRQGHHNEELKQRVQLLEKEIGHVRLFSHHFLSSFFSLHI